MNYEEALPFTDPPEVQECCGTCREFNGIYCMIDWNNADECYKRPEHAREPTDWCGSYEWDGETYEPDT